MAARATVEIIAQLRDQVTGPLRGISTALRSTFSGLRGLLTTALGGGVLYAVKAVAEAEVAVLRLARTTRSSVEDVSALKFALDDLGVGSNNLKELFNQLEGKRAGALRGTGGADRNAFARLGIDLKELRELGGVDILKQIGDGYLAAGKSADAAAQLQVIFGDRFREFLPLLEQGSSGFAELKKRADALGATFTGTEAANAEKFTKAYLEFTTVATGMFRDLANKWLPTITSLVSEVRDLLQSSSVIGFFEKVFQKGEQLGRAARGTAEERALQQLENPQRRIGYADRSRFDDDSIEALKRAGADFDRVEHNILEVFNAEEVAKNLRTAIQAELKDKPVEMPVKLDDKPIVPPGFMDGFRKEVSDTNDQLNEMFEVGKKAARELADVLGSNVNRVLAEVRQGTLKLKDALQSLLDGLIEDLTALATRELTSRLFNSILGLFSAAAAPTSGGSGQPGASGREGFGGGIGTSSIGGGRFIGNGRKSLFGGPAGLNGGGTTINLSSSQTQEDQRALVSAIMQHEASRNRQVRVAYGVV